MSPRSSAMSARERALAMVFMPAALVLARRLSTQLAPASSLWWTRQLAWLLTTAEGERSGVRAPLAALAHRFAHRLPLELDCYDRAIATRWLLALLGETSAQVVFGMRREGKWEGHAWLEFEDGETLFTHPSLGYKEIAREHPTGSVEARAPGARFGPISVALVRAALGTAGAQAYERAAELGLDALLYSMRDELDIPAPSSMKARWLAIRASALSRRHHLMQVLDVLEAAHDPLPVIVLKGEPLAQWLYGDGLARRSSDIDLLLSLEHIHEAGQRLLRAGYSPMHGPTPEPWLYNQWALAHERTGQLVELHWSLAAPDVPQPATHELFARARTMDYHGRAVRVLEPPDLYLHLSLHFHHHSGFLKGLMDLAGWMDRHGEAQLHTAMERAAALGMEKIASWPQGAMARLLGEKKSAHERGLLGGAASLWTATHARGVFGHSERLGGASALAFKTQEIMQLQVTTWRLLGALLYDDMGRGQRAALRIVLRSPGILAQARGAMAPSARDWMAWTWRPVRLVVRAAQEVAQGAMASHK